MARQLEAQRPRGPRVARVRDPYLSSFSLSSVSKGPDLRIGLLLRGVHLTRASISVIDDIEASSFARIEMILLSPAPAQGRRTGTMPFVRPLRSMSDALSRGVWQVYAELDRRRVRLLDDPLSVVDASGRLRGIPMVRVSPTEGYGDDGTTDHPGTSIRAAALDVIIHLGSANEMDADPRHELALDRAMFRCGCVRRVGVSLRRSRIRAKRAGVLRGDRRGGAGLHRLPGATPQFSNRRAHARHSCVSDRRGISYPQSRPATLRIDPSCDPEASGVARLWLGASRSSRKSTGLSASDSQQRQPTSKPFRLARWMGPRLVRKVALRLAMTITRRGPGWQWRTAIRADAGGGPEQRLGDMAGFRWLEAPPGRSYADPFLMRRNDRTWLFFEDQASPRDAGVISCVQVAADGPVGQPVVVVQSAGHVSYPYVFSDGDTAYMIPESSAENAVRLYRATNFPYEWEVVKELYRGRALDTSAWRHEGRWWFWTTLREPRSGALALMLFHADALDGPWTSHPQNPISMDVRNARSAGSIFSEGDRIFRPSQDCSRTYGYGFSLYEIITLSTTEYEERAVVKVGPDWHPGLYGTHTYNRSDRVETTDGKFKVTRRLRG